MHIQYKQAHVFFTRDSSPRNENYAIVSSSFVTPNLYDFIFYVEVYAYFKVNTMRVTKLWYHLVNYALYGELNHFYLCFANVFIFISVNYLYHCVKHLNN